MPSLDDIADLLPLMPRARDVVYQRAELPPQTDEAGAVLPKPVLHFGLRWRIGKPPASF